MDEVTIDVRLDHVAYTYPETELPVFMDLTLELPRGTVSFVGQNGTGKSTALLLAGARVHPALGTVSILGRDSRELVDEDEKNAYVSFIYQNMEFESEESIGKLMEWVYAHGHSSSRDPSLTKVLAKVLELDDVMNKKTQEVSKGELQRAIIAFSLLYGSRIIMMDEPIFALEYRQKELVMGFLKEYSQERAVSIYYSIHEFEISQKYSDWVVLFHKDRTVHVGPSSELLSADSLEKAYEIPYAMLYQKEYLYRESLGAPKLRKA